MDLYSEKMFDGTKVKPYFEGLLPSIPHGTVPVASRRTSGRICPGIQTQRVKGGVYIPTFLPYWKLTDTRATYTCLRYTYVPW
jgi:hypothetical protein